MVAIIAWAAQNAWRKSGELRERLTAVQLKSFQIADHIQETILELNNSVLRFGAYGDTNAWAHFQTASRLLDQWIDEQRAVLSSQKERQLLDLINTSYDHYMAAANAIEKRVRDTSPAKFAVQDFAEFERQSQRMLKQGLLLAGSASCLHGFVSGGLEALTPVSQNPAGCFVGSAAGGRGSGGGGVWRIDRAFKGAPGRESGVDESSRKAGLTGNVGRRSGA